MKKSVAAICLAALAGCMSAGGPVPAGKAFGNQNRDGSLSLRYSPLDFTSAQARTMAAYMCTGGALGPVGVAELTDGQTVLMTECASGSRYGTVAGATFAKVGDGLVEGHVTYSTPDQLLQEQFELRI